MSKEVEVMLKTGKPGRVVKQYRKESPKYLQKFITDKDLDIQRSAIKGYGIAGKRIGISPKQVETFIKSLEKLSPDNTDIIADTIAKLGDTALGMLLLRLQKSKSVQRVFYTGLLTQIGTDTVNDILLGSRITNPTEALRNEIILRLFTEIPINKTVYDARFKYGESVLEYKKIISNSLSSKDSDERYRALDACGAYPTITVEFAGAVTKILSQEKEDVQIKALRTLGELGNPEVISAISKHLSSSSVDLRNAAVKSLGTLGDAAGVPPLLKNTLLDPDEFVRQSTVNALGKIGAPAAKALVDLLDKDEYVEQVEIALKRVGVPSVKYLTLAMGHKNKNVRKNATDLAKMILTTKYGFEGTVVKLIELLRDKDTGVQEQVVETILEMGDPALEAVIRAIGNQDKVIRESSKDVLSQYAIMNVEMRLEHALNKNLIAGTELLVLLAVYSNDDEIKDYVFQQLESLMENPQYIDSVKEAVINNVLVTNNAFTDSDDDVRYSVAQIGYYLGSPMVTHLMNTFLVDKNEEVIEVALDSLGYLGPEAQNAVGDIFRLTKHKNASIRKSAVTALGSTEHPDAVPILIDCLGDDEVEIQEIALNALDNLGSSGIPALLDTLSHDNPKTRHNLIKYISKYGEEVYQPLIGNLTYQDKNFQEAAAYLIGELGPDFGEKLLSEIRLTPEESAQYVAIKGFGHLKYKPALPFLMDILRKKDKKLTKAIHSTEPFYEEALINQCLDELEQGGEIMEGVIKDFLKSASSNYVIVPVLEQIERQTPKKLALIEVMRKISDKDVNSKLIQLLESNRLNQAKKLVKIIESEPELVKMAEKVRSTIPS
ncbi:MAG: HEAT repeat domain-containing protein [Candidatus Hodarchaeales archaeon]|jgi:HEAT repeat protein